MKRRLAVFSAVLSLILAFCGILSVVTLHNNASFSPDYPMLDLTELLKKAEFSSEDYDTLFLQTGLGRYAVNTLRNKADYPQNILEFQQSFFKSRELTCVREVITTSMEYNSDSFKIFDAKPGYVLIMESSHSFGWRHGHAGLTVGEGRVLEAPIIGRPTSVYNLSSWQQYPTFVMLRLKNTEDTVLEEIAFNALNDLEGIIYNPIAGVFKKDQGEKPKNVQCAYLVWYAFKKAGIDIDSNGGRIVTVQDIKNCDLFEVVQVFGYDPQEFTARPN